MKEKIIDIAVQQMKSGGYEKLNFANIAEELNVSRANLHHHFKNKEGLGLAATQRYMEQYKAMLDQAQFHHDGDIRAFLGNIEDHLIVIFNESAIGNACIGSQLLHDSHAPEILRSLALKFFQEETALIEAQLVKARDKGVVEASMDIRSLTFKITATMHGIVQIGLFTVNRDETAERIKGSLTSLLD